jgi:hypothetical protein
MKNQYSPSGPTLGSHKGELSFQTRPPLPYALVAPESHDAPAYVIYKVRGDPGDYQFFNEPPKEVPQGYTYGQQQPGTFDSAGGWGSFWDGC